MVQLGEHLEQPALPLRRDADAVVSDFDHRPIAGAPGREPHVAGIRVYLAASLSRLPTERCPRHWSATGTWVAARLHGAQ
jgi:hypothetical protein